MSELPPGWVWTDTGTVTEVHGGIQKQPKRRPVVRRYPFLRVANVMRGRLDLREVHEIELFDGELEKFRLRVGDLLVVEGNGSPDQIGRAARWRGDIEDCVHQNHLIRVRPGAAIDSKYLTHYWNASRTTEYLRSVASSTSGLYVLTAAKLRGVSIPLPPLAEQRRIVAAIEEQFSRLDAGVAALESVRQNLKRMRASVLYAGVTGQLVDQEHSEGSGADLLASIKLDRHRTSRRHENLATYMPQLPQSWTTAKWPAVGWSQNGRAFPSADYARAGVRLLRPGNLYASGQVVWTVANTRCLPERYAHEFPGYLVGPNEIVMNLTAQSLKDEFLGRVCITGPQDERVLLNQRIARLSPIGMNPRFVFYVMKSLIFRRFVDQLNTGSLIQHMFTSQLDQFLLPVPPRGEQDRIVEQIEQYLACLDYIDNVVAVAGERIPALRAAILSAAFSGSLVSQNHDDEPASALIERITSELESTNGHKRGHARKSLLPREDATI